MPRTFVLVLGLGLTLATACTGVCSLEGHAEGLSVDVDQASSPLGMYRLEVIVGEQVASLEYRIVEPTNPPSSAIACPDPCDTIFELSTYSGSFWYGGDRKGLGFDLRDEHGLGPPAIALRVERDGTTIHQEVLEPTYKTYDPDGSGRCHDDYTYASETVIVP